MKDPEVPTQLWFGTPLGAAMLAGVLGGTAQLFILRCDTHGYSAFVCSLGILSKAALKNLEWFTLWLPSSVLYCCGPVICTRKLGRILKCLYWGGALEFLRLLALWMPPKTTEDMPILLVCGQCFLYGCGRGSILGLAVVKTYGLVPFPKRTFLYGSLGGGIVEAMHPILARVLLPDIYSVDKFIANSPEFWAVESIYALLGGVIFVMSATWAIEHMVFVPPAKRTNKNKACKVE